MSVYVLCLRFICISCLSQIFLVQSLSWTPGLYFLLSRQQQGQCVGYIISIRELCRTWALPATQGSTYCFQTLLSVTCRLKQFLLQRIAGRVQYAIRKQERSNTPWDWTKGTEDKIQAYSPVFHWTAYSRAQNKAHMAILRGPQQLPGSPDESHVYSSLLWTSDKPVSHHCIYPHPYLPQALFQGFWVKVLLWKMACLSGEDQEKDFPEVLRIELQNSNQSPLHSVHIRSIKEENLGMQRMVPRSLNCQGSFDSLFLEQGFPYSLFIFWLSLSSSILMGISSLFWPQDLMITLFLFHDLFHPCHHVRPDSHL